MTTPTSATPPSTESAITADPQSDGVSCPAPAGALTTDRPKTSHIPHLSARTAPPVRLGVRLGAGGRDRRRMTERTIGRRRRVLVGQRFHDLAPSPASTDFTGSARRGLDEILDSLTVQQLAFAILVKPGAIAIATGHMDTAFVVVSGCERVSAALERREAQSEVDFTIHDRCGSSVQKETQCASRSRHGRVVRIKCRAMPSLTARIALALIVCAWAQPLRAQDQRPVPTAVWAPKPAQTAPYPPGQKPWIETAGPQGEAQG